MNSVEITLDSNEIVEDLSKFKRSKYRFVIESSLFSSNLHNDTNIIFITCNGLSHARKALIINSKLYKILGVVYLSQIKNWDLVKVNLKDLKSFLLIHNITQNHHIRVLLLQQKTYLICLISQ